MDVEKETTAIQIEYKKVLYERLLKQKKIFPISEYDEEYRKAADKFLNKDNNGDVEKTLKELAKKYKKSEELNLLITGAKQTAKERVMKKLNTNDVSDDIIETNLKKLVISYFASFLSNRNTDLTSPKGIKGLGTGKLFKRDPISEELETSSDPDQGVTSSGPDRSLTSSDDDSESDRESLNKKPGNVQNVTSHSSVEGRLLPVSTEPPVFAPPPSHEGTAAVVPLTNEPVRSAPVTRSSVRLAHKQLEGKQVVAAPVSVPHAAASGRQLPRQKKSAHSVDDESMSSEPSVLEHTISHGVPHAAASGRQLPRQKEYASRADDVSMSSEPSVQEPTISHANVEGRIFVPPRVELPHASLDGRSLMEPPNEAGVLPNAESKMEMSDTDAPAHSAIEGKLFPREQVAVPHAEVAGRAFVEAFREETQNQEPKKRKMDTPEPQTSGIPPAPVEGRVMAAKPPEIPHALIEGRVMATKPPEIPQALIEGRVMATKPPEIPHAPVDGRVMATKPPEIPHAPVEGRVMATEKPEVKKPVVEMSSVDTEMRNERNFSDHPKEKVVPMFTERNDVDMDNESTGEEPEEKEELDIGKADESSLMDVEKQKRKDGHYLPRSVMTIALFAYQDHQVEKKTLINQEEWILKLLEEENASDLLMDIANPYINFLRNIAGFICKRLSDLLVYPETFKRVVMSYYYNMTKEEIRRGDMETDPRKRLVLKRQELFGRLMSSWEQMKPLVIENVVSAVSSTMWFIKDFCPHKEDFLIRDERLSSTFTKIVSESVREIEYNNPQRPTPNRKVLPATINKLIYLERLRNDLGYGNTRYPPAPKEIELPPLRYRPVYTLLDL